MGAEIYDLNSHASLLAEVRAADQPAEVIARTKTRATDYTRAIRVCTPFPPPLPEPNPGGAHGRKILAAVQSSYKTGVHVGIQLGLMMYPHGTLGVCCSSEATGRLASFGTEG